MRKGWKRFLSSRIFWSCLFFTGTAWIPAFSGSSLGSVTPGSAPQNTVVATVAVGDEPSGIAISPDSRTVYVANSLSNSVSVIDANNGYAVKATITGLNTPIDLVTNLTGTLLYVTNLIPGAVSVIDTTQANYPIISTLTVGTSPESLALSPDGKSLYVANLGYYYQANAAGSVSVIDTTTNQVSTTIDAPGNPFFVLFVQEGKQVDILNRGGTGFLQLIDTITLKVLPFFPAEGILYSPRGMTTDRSASTLYIANYQNYVSVVRPDDGSVLKEILVAPNVFTLVSLGKPALTPNGKYLYVPYGGISANGVVMIDLGTDQVTGEPITVGSPVWAQIAPDGRTLYVDSNPGNTVTVIDISPKE
jgi:YVTN family beta-propeller protein